mmetsp:Transcript_5727/g.13708  ORF Transcript_5727/g.13708 Transcript_5727/m.13708 type:complete len:193 (-) Transcript_5727:384-962(-)|eukprot:CAMPEP_0116091202 /NCGR_PEP_ID=MMETSP0327-20121206/7380_1 /TAXON_ID=44447 /ORGANISM="Pseudo-nitzschia delicatissima, Strain B596" /LENGTH=192 /DNA_ID=CAMNT_0003582539 /DNA_START=87 /DNA_END=665 /DNA_ORIENTATION=+
MTVHSFHVFDRRGKTLFTKCYVKKEGPVDEEQLSEQRKLIFGMLFSLRELSGSLTDGQGDLHLVKTGASSLYNYETVSGLRFVLYTTADKSKPTTSTNAETPLSVNPATGMINSATAESTTSSNSSYHGTTNPAVTNDIRSSLRYIYETIWITSVIRSPMYRPSAKDHAASIQATNFEAELDGYLKRKSWYR